MQVFQFLRVILHLLLDSAICIKNKVIGACAGDITVIMQRKLCCGKKIQIEIKTV